MTMG
ncbi:hypothetical protein Avbf_12028 [Armadillidium vulgare]